MGRVVVRAPRPGARGGTGAGLRVIVVLANRWADYGGAPRYLAWSGVLPEGDAGVAGACARALLHRPGAAGSTASTSRAWWARVNAVTMSPTATTRQLLAELINESDASRRTREGSSRGRSDMPTTSASLDPNHLVAAGQYRVHAARAARHVASRPSGCPVGYADAHAPPARLRHRADARRFRRHDRRPLRQLARHVAGSVLTG